MLVARTLVLSLHPLMRSPPFYSHGTHAFASLPPTCSPFPVAVAVLVPLHVSPDYPYRIPRSARAAGALAQHTHPP